MGTQVTVTLPDEVYRRAERLAQLSHRDISEVLTDMITLSLPVLHPQPDVPTPVETLSDEGGRGLIRAGDGALQPLDQLGGTLGMLPGQGPADQDALDRLGQVQPRPAEWGVEWELPVLEEPLHDRPTQMTGEVVPD